MTQPTGKLEEQKSPTTLKMEEDQQPDQFAVPDAEGELVGYKMPSPRDGGIIDVQPIESAAKQMPAASLSDTKQVGTTDTYKSSVWTE